MIPRSRRQDRGALAVEYGLIVFAISVLCIAALIGLGRAVHATMDFVQSQSVGSTEETGVADPPAPLAPAEPTTSAASPPLPVSGETCDAAPCD